MATLQHDSRVYARWLAGWVVINRSPGLPSIFILMKEKNEKKCLSLKEGKCSGDAKGKEKYHSALENV